MNKWVVVLLVALAFAAGLLSNKLGQQPAATATSTPLPAASAPAVAQATPAVETAPSSGLPRRNSGKGPHFGNPPRPGSSPAGAVATSSGAIQGEIRAMVFSTEPGGLSLTRFSPSAGNIYLTLSPVGMPEDQELVASFRSTASENAPFSAPVQSSGPPRLRTFRFAPPDGGWVSGAYQVVVKPAGGEQVLTVNRFDIAKADAATPAKFESPEYVHLGNSKDNNAPGSVFSAEDQRIYLRVASYKVPGTPIRSVWSAVEVQELTPGELFAVTETVAPGEDEDALFTFDPPKGGFLPGSYRVDVYFDQQQVGSQAFFIQPSATAAASATPAAATP